MEKEHFLAGVGFDEEGVGLALSDVGGQDGIGGLVVVQARGNVIQPVDPQKKRHHEDKQQQSKVYALSKEKAIHYAPTSQLDLG